MNRQSVGWDLSRKLFVQSSLRSSDLSVHTQNSFEKSSRTTRLRGQGTDPRIPRKKIENSQFTTPQGATGNSPRGSLPNGIFMLASWVAGGTFGAAWGTVGGNGEEWH